MPDAPPGTRDDAALACRAASRFQVSGRPVAAERIGSGHIHDTWLVRFGSEAGAGARPMLLQHLNGAVFPDLEAVMGNVARVTGHLREALRQRGVPELERRCLQLVPTRDGEPFLVDEASGSWRSFRWIEGAFSVDAVADPRQAFEAARAFGRFVLLLSDLGPPPLAVTIPHFHDLPHRFAALERAERADPSGRASGASREIESVCRGFEQVQAALARLAADSLPRRVVHHDCKLNNVMLDARTGEGLCVIDLDTVMEGTIVSDFGELVRTTVCSSSEDEPDPSRTRLDLEVFGAVARGFRSGLEDLLTEAEVRLLPLAGGLLALMNGIRFLTDHLEGDGYFRVQRPDQNLDRARAQLRRFQLLQQAEPELRRILRAV